MPSRRSFENLSYVRSFQQGEYVLFNRVYLRLEGKQTREVLFLDSNISWGTELTIPTPIWGTELTILMESLLFFLDNNQREELTQVRVLRAHIIDFEDKGRRNIDSRTGTIVQSWLTIIKLSWKDNKHSISDAKSSSLPVLCSSGWAVLRPRKGSKYPGWKWSKVMRGEILWVLTDEHPLAFKLKSLKLYITLRPSQGN